MDMLFVFTLVLIITGNGIAAETGCINEDFIKAREGFETAGYVPKDDNGIVLGHSGVTIGNGIDLGSKNRQYFVDLSVATALIDKLEPYFGLQGQAAVNKLTETPLTLTTEEATDLSDKVLASKTAGVKTTYNNAIDASKETWDELTDAQRTVIASVLFQYGSPSKTPTFWGHCKEQDWVKVEAELRAFGDNYPTRRNLEADLLKNDDGSDCGVKPTTTTLPPTTTKLIAGEQCSAIEKVSRAGWNARAATKVLPALSKAVSMVFIHHTTGNSCTDKASCIAEMKQHQDYHMDHNKWSDIGYNYLVGEDGRAYEGRGLDKQGGHTFGYNTRAIAISVIGDYSSRKPVDDALTVIKAIINCAIDDGVLASNYKLYGHRDAACTECPGDKLYEEIQTWAKYSTQGIQKYCNKKPWSGGTSSSGGSTTPAPATTDPSSTAGPCGMYGDLRKLKPKGASVKTAQQDKLSTKGVDASSTLLDTDLSELNNYKACFYEVGLEKNIHPALIAAIASRESRAGKLLDNNGYGDNGKAYGMMQCDIANSGLDCTKYGATSCDHVKMLVEERIIPDILSVRKKLPTWTAERQLQGAVAAYNFGVGNVQTWPGLDQGSTNDDYSHDIIARAQRLISPHGWICDASASGISSIPTTAPVPPSGSGTCIGMANAGNCEFYPECVEKMLACGDSDYTLGYAYKSCNKFAQYNSGFNSVGKDWVNKVQICLMNYILPHSRKPGITCDRVSSIALDSHVGCYTTSGDGICEVAKTLANLNALQSVFEDFYGGVWKRAWSQVLQAVYDCDISQASSWYTSAKQLLGDEVSAITDVEDCSGYASSGDCQFYECFEKKFPCGSTFGYSHVRDFELAHCMEFKKLQLSAYDVSGWASHTQSCMMSHLKPVYSQSSVKCAALELHMYEARVVCMVDQNSFCSLGRPDEWMIERGTDDHGYPFLLPKLYTTWPLSGTTHLTDENYYKGLQGLKGQIGQANMRCAQQGGQQSSSLYELKDTKFGTLKIRTGH